MWIYENIDHRPLKKENLFCLILRLDLEYMLKENRSSHQNKLQTKIQLCRSKKSNQLY